MNKIVYKQETLKRICYKLRRFLRFERLLPAVWRKIPIGSYMFRMHFDAVERPHYAFGIYSACIQACALDIPRITICEFGVAGGNGLMAMERAAAKIGRVFGVEVDIVGFDIATGLPPSDDYRDLPYFFVRDSYKMDVAALEKRLHKARLVFGDIRETVPAFIESFNGAPIGFCVFDLDYYTSTRDALKILSGSSETRLPRAIAYFDDVFGISDLSIYCNRVGPVAAIHEFNGALDTNRFLAPIEKLRNNRAIPDEWNDRMYAFHDFEHPLYNNVINPYSAEFGTQCLSLK